MQPEENPIIIGVNVKKTIFLKKLKKVVDIGWVIWYIIRALWKKSAKNDLWKLSKTSIWVARKKQTI